MSIRLSAGLLACCLSQGVLAWGADGHHTVAEIAYQLLDGTEAKVQVDAILGSMKFIDASVWADCAKGVNKDFKYAPTKVYKECDALNLNLEQKDDVAVDAREEIEDFVRRNWDNCKPNGISEICHKGYHFTNVNITQNQYKKGLVGTRDDDIVGAIVAAIHVLKDEPVLKPFNFKNKREALIVLTHYVGDIHQPLHVGAIYLDVAGNSVDPDEDQSTLKMDTRGGNNLILGEASDLHSFWDDVPDSIIQSQPNSAMLTAAEKVPATKGDIDEWPSYWATQTLEQSRNLLKIPTYSEALDKDNCMKLGKCKWKVNELPQQYWSKADVIKEHQLISAGAHLAELLKAIWPSKN